MESWIRDDFTNPLLWLNGKPGAGRLRTSRAAPMMQRKADDLGETGKSVMCTSIIGTLLQTPDMDTAYYFCNGQDGDNVCVQLLKSLALQSLRQHQDAASLIANEFMYKAKNCGLQELRTLIPQLLAISSYARIIVDGVDECSKHGQKAILKVLKDLCLSRNSHCKILFSSRKEVYLAKMLSAKPQIPLDGTRKLSQTSVYVLNTRFGSLEHLTLVF